MSEAQVQILLTAILQHPAFVSLERRRGEWWCTVQDVRPTARPVRVSRSGLTPEAATSAAVRALLEHVEANP